MMKRQPGSRGDTAILIRTIWYSQVTIPLWARELAEHLKTAVRWTSLITSGPGCEHSSCNLTLSSAKDRAGLHPLSKQRANISLAIMCVYVSINIYVYIGIHTERFLIKSVWTLFLGQKKATDEEACSLAVIQLCTFSASGIIMSAALLKWAPYHFVCASSLTQQPKST